MDQFITRGYCKWLQPYSWSCSNASAASKQPARPVKKIPKIGEDKYVIESRVVFEPEDEPGVLDGTHGFPGWDVEDSDSRDIISIRT